MKTLHLSTIALILALALAALAAPATTHAQTVSPNPAPTIITTAPYVISKPGYYQLGANLTYAGNGSPQDAIITINAGNVTLDFAGHYITEPTDNPNSTLYGVYAYERGNLTIQNGTITYCHYGINLEGNGSSTSHNINQQINNMLVSHCYYVGIDGYEARYSAVTNCRVSSTGENTSYAIGILLFGQGTVVTGCTVTNVQGSTYGIGINGATFAAGNFVSNATYGLNGCAKYKDNLTSGCATPFSGGTDAGGNN